MVSHLAPLTPPPPHFHTSYLDWAQGISGHLGAGLVRTWGRHISSETTGKRDGHTSPYFCHGAFAVADLGLQFLDGIVKPHVHVCKSFYL